MEGRPQVPPEMLAANECVTTIREYAGSPALQTVLRRLGQLERDYLEELRLVQPEGLPFLQGKLAQATALRRLLSNEPHCDGSA